MDISGAINQFWWRSGVQWSIKITLAYIGVSLRCYLGVRTPLISRQNAPETGSQIPGFWARTSKNPKDEKKAKIFKKLDNDEFEESEVFKISDQTGIHVGFHGYIWSNKSVLVAQWRTVVHKNYPGIHWRESQMLSWRENSINFTPKCARNWLSDPWIFGPDKQKSKK